MTLMPAVGLPRRRLRQPPMLGGQRRGELSVVAGGRLLHQRILTEPTDRELRRQATHRGRKSLKQPVEVGVSGTARQWRSGGERGARVRHALLERRLDRVHHCIRLLAASRRREARVHDRLPRVIVHYSDRAVERFAAVKPFDWVDRRGAQLL